VDAARESRRHGTHLDQDGAGAGADEGAAGREHDLFDRRVVCDRREDDVGVRGQLLWFGRDLRTALLQIADAVA